MPNDDEALRVNLAGEYAAIKIYQAQARFASNDDDKELYQKMLLQEELHFQYFKNEVIRQGVRPSILMPVWGVLGSFLGALSVKLGKDSAMICTEAVEEVIEQHYKEQAKDPSIDPIIKEKIDQFREDELHHKAIAAEKRQMDNLALKIFANLIKCSCKAAISIAKKI